MTLTKQQYKRITLNALIQGCSVNAYLTAHHVKRAELRAIDHNLVNLYDQFTWSTVAYYFNGQFKKELIDPQDFWETNHFGDHPIFAPYGKKLFNEASNFLRSKIVSPRELGNIFLSMITIESNHRTKLEALAKETAHEIIGLPLYKMEASLTSELHVLNATSRASQDLASTSIGTVSLGRTLSKVEADLCGTTQGIYVDAKAMTFPVLVQELIKGGMELLTLPALASLSDQEYKEVTEVTDKIELEPFLIQVGPELWRKFLAVRPKAANLPKLISDLSKMQPDALQHVIKALIEDPAWAAELLENISQGKSLLT